MKALRPTTIPFPSTGSFTRASTATYIEDGILKTAAVNEPRWQDGNLLVEGEGTNLLLQSDAFEQAVWVKGAVSVAPGVGPLLAGAPSDKLVETTATGVHLVRQDFSATSGVTYTFSVFLSAGERTKALVWFGGVSSGVAVDLSTGTASVVPGFLDPSNYAISAVSGGYAVSVTMVSTLTGLISASVYVLATDFAGRSYTGDGTSGIFVRAAQVVSGQPTSYIPTTTTPATRAADVCIGNFSRASVGTYVNSNGVLQTAGINVPRIQNGKLLIEEYAFNSCLNNNTTSVTPYTSGGATVSITSISDPFWGTVLRVTKTAGTPGGLNRAGVRWNVGSVIGPDVTCSIWVRKPNSSVTGYAPYCDMNKALGGYGSPTRSLATINAGEWVKASGTYVSNTTDGYVGGYIYVWVDSAVGDYIDVALPCVFSGTKDSSAIVTSGIYGAERQPDLHTAGIVYTTATDARALWSSATTYSVGQVIRYNNTVYESLQNTNLNKQPDTNPTWWLSLGADNISAAFDGKVGSKTITTDKLRMIVYPGTVVDAVGYLETNSVVVNTSVVDANRNLAYSNSTGFTESNIESWYDYFFVNPLSDPATQVVHQGIPALDPNLVIGVELINPGTVELGSFLTGQSTTIGKTQYGLKAGIVDYSKKQADEFGNISIIERPYSKRMSGDVYVSNYDLNKVQRFLYNVRATPVLWMASDNPDLAEVSYVYGFYKDFSTTISYPDVSMCSLEIEGLI